MALPATDSFIGTNNDPLSASWTELDGDWIIFNNQAWPNAAATNLALWNADAFANDHYSEAVIGVINTAKIGVGVRLAATRGYLLLIDNGTAGWSIERLNSAESFTVLTSGATGVTAGDTIRLEVTGDFIEAFKNGTPLGNTTDATFASGGAGLVGYNVGGQNLESWEGGNMGAEPPAVPPFVTTVDVRRI